jgi:uncharacterized protein (TIGR03437 family)
MPPTLLRGFLWTTLPWLFSAPLLAQPVINGYAHAGSYASEVVAPGEIVDLFGTGLGPAALTTLKLDSTGKVATSLAGVTVTFNSIASPLIYVSATQVAAVVPYEIAGQASAALAISFGGAVSSAVTVKIAATLPGIFSADSSGTGNAAASNSDGSFNSASHPAAPGSAVTLYLTGVGQTIPPSSTGAVAAAASSINSPVSVTIGGLAVPVLYAGGAPGEVNGVAQINVVVPADLPYGGNLPLFVQVGNVSSQPGLTLAVSGSSAPVSLTTTFSPNSTTISTSEGAPYANCDFWVQASCTNQSNFGYGPTKVVRVYICLSGQVSTSACSQQAAVTGPLSASMLDAINSRLAAYAGSGVRLIPRFTYNFGPIGSGAMDAPLSVILNHIDQLAPVLLQNKDLILALEAGFIGTWGEWHDSTNGNDAAAPHKAVLDKELGYFNGVFPVLVRAPADIMQYTGNATPPPGIGLHDDYYASGADDAGTFNPCAPRAGWCDSTYTAASLQSLAAAVSTNTLFAGEFGALYPALQSCDALDAYSYQFHVQSIVLTPSPASVGTELQTEGCVQSFYNQVGTRIVLQQVQVSGTAVPGGQLAFSLTLRNSGYGRVIRPRPATLVFLQGAQAVAQIPIPLTNLDLRTLQSFTSKTFQFSVTLPGTLSSGPLKVALLVPDPAPSLNSLPAYALPLNSLVQGNPIFDPSTGYNYLLGSGPALSTVFKLDPAGAITSDSNEVVDGSYSIKGSYAGTGTFTPYLETVASALPLAPNHKYQVTFRYKILTTPTKGFETLFFSPTGGTAGNFLPAMVVNGKAGDTGTATLTSTLGPYSDYEARWDVPGTGAIAIDDIQIIDTVTGQVIAGLNVEPAVPSPLTVSVR